MRFLVVAARETGFGGDGARGFPAAEIAVVVPRDPGDRESAPGEPDAGLPLSGVEPGSDAG